MKRVTSIIILAVIGITILLIGAEESSPSMSFILAGYAVPREAYDEIIPLFEQYWLAETGQTVQVLESYQASGAQSRAIAGGFEADVAALSIEPDITRLVDAGLVRENWRDNDYAGIVANSLVVFAVRPGNPLHIQDWADLTTGGVEVIMPDPITSGGAQWNILGGYGAVLRGHVPGFEGEAGALDFLRALMTNVSVLDRDSRESFLTFERGIGDVAVTYENEVYAGLLAGGEYELIYPQSTIRVENPVTVIDAYVDTHGTREVAEAFVDFLWSDAAQRIFANHGFRPVNPNVLAEMPLDRDPLIVFPPVPDEFLVTDLGGWSEVRAAIFSDTGLFTQVMTETRGQ